MGRANSDEPIVRSGGAGSPACVPGPVDNKPKAETAIASDPQFRTGAESTTAEWTVSDGVIRALQAERERIARDIHDRAAQDVALLRLALRFLRRAGLSAVGERELAAAEERLEQLSRSFASIIHELRSPSTADIIPELLEIAGTWSNALPISLDVAVQGCRLACTRDVAMALTAFLQEALTNVSKHSLTATEVRVTISTQTDEIQIVVEDDGVGVTMSTQTKSDTEHRYKYGLQGMKERMQRLGGSILIESGAPQGTRVAARVSRGALNDGA
jgi:two-component system sensor histidine kinase DegS